MPKEHSKWKINELAAAHPSGGDLECPGCLGPAGEVLGTAAARWEEGRGRQTFNHRHQRAQHVDCSQGCSVRCKLEEMGWALAASSAFCLHGNSSAGPELASFPPLSLPPVPPWVNTALPQCTRFTTFYSSDWNQEVLTCGKLRFLQGCSSRSAPKVVLGSMGKTSHAGTSWGV